MSRSLRCLGFLLFLPLPLLGQSSEYTIYYQPTPYPTLKSNGQSMPQDLSIIRFWNGTRYDDGGQSRFDLNNNLRIGGTADKYSPMLRYDLTGLPENVSDSTLYLYTIPSGAAYPSKVSIWPIATDWDITTIGTSAFPNVSTGSIWPVSSTVNTWRGYDVTDWYNSWKNGTRPNYGLLLYGANRDGQVERADQFLSSRTTDDGHRPILSLTFTPSMRFKMPLPGGYRWLVTNEIGGYECTGMAPWPDIAHQDANYYSIDFTHGGDGYSGPVPVLAPASGYIIFAGGGDDNPNGYNATIDHDTDCNSATGFQTRYLHLASPPCRKDGTLLVSGDYVSQGDQIGVMGTTGHLADGTPTSTGIHLHFGVRYQNSGAPSSPELAKVVMEGWILKSFQTECSMNSSGRPITWIRQYMSTNSPSGQ